MGSNNTMSRATSFGLALFAVSTIGQAQDLRKGYREYLEPPVYSSYFPGDDEARVIDVAIADDGLTMVMSYEMQDTRPNVWPKSWFFVTVFERTAPGQDWTSTIRPIFSSEREEPRQVEIDSDRVYVASYRLPMSPLGQPGSSQEAAFSVYRRASWGWPRRQRVNMNLWFQSTTGSPSFQHSPSFASDFDVQGDYACITSPGGYSLTGVPGGVAYVLTRNALSGNFSIAQQVFTPSGWPQPQGFPSCVAIDSDGPNTRLALGVPAIGTFPNSVAVYELVGGGGASVPGATAINPVLASVEAPNEPNSGRINPESVDIDVTRNELVVGCPRSGVDFAGSVRLLSFAPATNTWDLSEIEGSPRAEESSSSANSQAFGTNVELNGAGLLLGSCLDPNDTFDPAYVYETVAVADELTPVTWLGNAVSYFRGADFEGDFAVTAAVNIGGVEHAVVHSVGAPSGIVYGTPCGDELAPCNNASSFGCRTRFGWSGVLQGAGTLSLSGQLDDPENSFRLFLNSREAEATASQLALLGSPQFANNSVLPNNSRGIIGLNSVVLLETTPTIRTWSDEHRQWFWPVGAAYAGAPALLPNFTPMVGTTWAFQAAYLDNLGGNGGCNPFRTVNYSNSVNATFSL